MGRKECGNVNFSDRSYEAKMTKYISYKLGGKIAKVIGTSKSSTRLWNNLVT